VQSKDLIHVLFDQQGIEIGPLKDFFARFSEPQPEEIYDRTEDLSHT
jgi:hypothetical protein